MTNISIISGSTLGSAEYVAEHLAEILTSQNIAVELFHGPDLEELPLSGVWLVVTSTHGAGDLPDNLEPLFEQIQQSKVDLSQIKFGAIGLGNKEYDLFCGAIKKVNTALIERGAKRIGEVLEIDVTEHEIPEDPAEIWLNDWLKLFNN
jgi:MioC protein